MGSKSLGVGVGLQAGLPMKPDEYPAQVPDEFLALYMWAESELEAINQELSTISLTEAEGTEICLSSQ